jgi:hypothetical protein
VTKVTIVAVDVVDCAAPHQEEIIARVAHPADRKADFPGDEALIEHAEVACLEEFERWVGRPYAESALALGYLWPQAKGWALGDRTIFCIAALPEGGPLVGTVRGSGR